MKLLKKPLLTLMSMLSLVALHAQSVDDIISKHIAAIGGHDLVTKIKSVSIDATVSAMGNDFPTSVTLVKGKAYKTATSVNGSDIITCVTDTGGWSINPMAGQSSPAPLSSDQAKILKSSLFVSNDALVDYKSNGYTAEYIGQDTAKGKAYKVKLTDGSSAILTYYIDPTTYYTQQIVIDAKVNGSDMSITSAFSDYKKTDYGLVMAFTTNTTNMGYDITVTYNKVEFDKAIDPKIFDMPKN